MRTVTPDFLTTLRNSHLVAVEATIEQPGQPPVTVDVVGGQITLDATAPVRRRGTLQIPWTVEPNPASPVEVRSFPFGAYAVLKRGVRYSDGTRELVTLGRLRIDAVSSKVSEGTTSLELSDRMAQIADEPLLAPFVPTVNATSAIVALVQDVFGTSIAYHRLTDEPSEPAIVDAAYTGDRVKAITDLAATVAAEAYFDALGDLVVAPRPPLSATPVWNVDSGLTGVLVDVDESLDRTETANGVLVTGQASADQPPISALVVDNTVGSPTLWGGPFGKVALVLESTAVQTVAQATAQATAELERRLTLARNLTLTTVPNPALEPGDVVTATFPDGRVEDHVVVALTVPLEAAPPIELVSRAVDRPAATRAILGAEAWKELSAA